MVRYISAMIVIVLLATSMAGAQDKKEDDKSDFKKDETVRIQVRKTSVRSQPKVLAKVVGRLIFADPVEVEETFGKGWTKVKSAEKKIDGWLRSSALTKTEIKKLESGDGATRATGKEISMAGKGLKEAMDDYINKNNLKAAGRVIDDIEQRPYTELSIEQVIAFIKASDLKPKGSA